MWKKFISFFKPSAWDIIGWAQPIWPLFVSGLVAIAGWLEGQSVMWIMVAVSLVFAGFSVGLLKFDELLFRRKVADKLQFSSVRLGKKLNNEGSVCELNLGFTLHNTATFPIEFKVESIEAHLGERFPPKRPYAQSSLVVPQGGYGWFDDHFIEIPNPPKNQSKQGSLSFSVSYGRPGHLMHKLERRLRVFVGFDENGNVTGANWDEGL